MTIAIDTETFLIETGKVVPRLVCLSFATSDGDSGVVHVRDPFCREFVEYALDSSERLVGQNMPFDLAVFISQWPELIERVFAAYDSDRIVDTMVRQKLLDIAHGVYRGFRSGATGLWIEYKYSLADLAKRHKYPVLLDKDTYRLRFGEFIDTEIPEEAKQYSLHDALSTLWVHDRQEPDAQFLVDQYRQSRAHFALHLTSAWGVTTDPRMVEKLEWLTRKMLEDHEQLLLQYSLIEPKPKGGFTKKMKRAQEYALQAWTSQGRFGHMVLTEGGKPSLNEDAADQLGDPVVTAFQEYSSASTILARVEELRQSPIHTRFDELMVSGRTSSSKPNVQNRSTSIMVRTRCEHATNAKKVRCPDCGKLYHLAGDREAFVARPGHVLLVSDVPGLELRTIAQTCVCIVGYSRLGEILNAGKDPHIEVAATLKGWSLEIAYKRKKDPNDTEAYLARQTGKVVNFGLNARLGWRGLIHQARTKYGVTLNEQEAKAAIEAYYTTLPEMRDFHDWVDANCAQHRLGNVVHLYSGRQQGLVPPTVMSNTFSQGLGADATKSALYSLVKECYIGSGPLLGSRSVNYVHDEYHVETLEENLDAKGEAMADIVCDEANKWLPDVPIPREEMRPIVCRRWSKKAAQVKNADGTLGVWEWKEWLEQCAQEE